MFGATNELIALKVKNKKIPIQTIAPCLGAILNSSCGLHLDNQSDFRTRTV